MRRLAVALSLAAVPLAAAGCGGAKSTTGDATTALDASSAVQQAVAKTLKAGSVHIAVTASASTGGQDVTLTGSGAFDSKMRRGTLHANVSLGGIQTSIDEVLDGTTAYAQSPLLSALLPAGKTWLKIDLTAAGKALGVDTTVLRAQDPAVALAQLKALQKVREVGTAPIGGVQSTHYRGTIDVAKLPQGSAGVLSSAGTTLGPADVWVGERRLRPPRAADDVELVDRVGEDRRDDDALAVRRRREGDGPGRLGDRGRQQGVDPRDRRLSECRSR